MSKVIAAIDTSAAARPVLSTAVAVAALFRAELAAIHVDEGAPDAARAAAEAAGVTLKLVTGPTLQGIVHAAGEPDVVAVVVGARGTPGGRRPAGHVATQVVTSVLKPVVVVPPDCDCPVRLGRILVPLEAVAATASALRHIVQAAFASGTEVVVLHVFDESALPLFTDQPQHEVEAWITEFLRTYCQGLDGVRVELRAGVPRDHLLATADKMRADALVLGWSQRLAPGRASLVKAALERSPIPIILVPVGNPAPAADPA